MNIQRITKAIEAYQSNTKRPVTGSAKNRDLRDEINISPQARLYDLAKKAAANVPDVRQDKIDGILKRMESGEYNVSALDVAKKMLG